MFDIPIGARHIVIEENETSPHIIGEYLPHPFPSVELFNTAGTFHTNSPHPTKPSLNFIGPFKALQLHCKTL